VAQTVEDPQGGLFDRVIDDEALEAACARYIFTKAGAKDHAKAKKSLYDRLNDLNVEDGETVRIGRFKVVGRARKGGGFDVPPWEKTGIGAVVEIV